MDRKIFPDPYSKSDITHIEIKPDIQYTEMQTEAEKMKQLIHDMNAKLDDILTILKSDKYESK